MAISPPGQDLLQGVCPVRGGGQRQGGPTPFPVYQCVPLGESGRSREGPGWGCSPPGHCCSQPQFPSQRGTTSDAKLLGRVTGHDHGGRDKSGGATCILSYPKRHSAVEGSWGSPKCQAGSGLTQAVWFPPDSLSQSCFPPAWSGAWKRGGLPWPRSCLSNKVGLLRTMQTRGVGGTSPLIPTGPRHQNRPEPADWP